MRLEKRTFPSLIFNCTSFNLLQQLLQTLIRVGLVIHQLEGEVAGLVVLRDQVANRFGQLTSAGKRRSLPHTNQHLHLLARMGPLDVEGPHPVIEAGQKVPSGRSSSRSCNKAPVGLGCLFNQDLVR